PPRQRGTISVEGRPVLFQAVELPAQVHKRLVRVAGAHLAGVAELLAVVAVIAHEQRAQAHARALRVREATDHELLPAHAFDLHPAVAASADVAALCVLADDALLPLLARLPPKRLAVV